ncbi:MAG: ASKHA domain-containing protein [Kiloniellales bacterium]
MVESAYVVFTPSGKRGRFPIGASILACARQLGVDIDSVCGGRGICGRCQVSVGEGEFAKHGITSSAESLEPLTEPERKYDGRKGLAADRRLGCHARLLADAVIDVPPESQVHRQVVRKRAEARLITVDPVVKPYYIEIAKPNLHQPSGDFQRLNMALKKDWGLTLHDTDLHVLRSLQQTLREGDWKVTLALRHTLGRYDEIVGIWPGFQGQLYGLAVDVGSTTVACHLCDLSSGEVLAAAGAMNPQIRFGEDLMSRVSYVMDNPASLDEMTKVVLATINKLAQETAAEAGIDPRLIIETVLVGNPIMHHLVLGLDPSELGLAPFALCTDEAVKVYAEEDLGIDIALGSRAYFLPCIAGHVGADAAAVILSEGPHLSDAMTLIIDVGTNAEIVLGNKERLLAASSPTGPAFEGAQITCGQRAAPGAIERVRIDRETLEPRVKVIGSDLWSDEDGFADAVSSTGVTGICGSGIIELLGEMFLAGLLTRDGVIDGRLRDRSSRLQARGETFSYLICAGEPEIVITQEDVRAVQLAKGALFAGARLLMDHMGIEQLDRVVLTGAFGSHIDPFYALLLGMFPDCPLEKISSAGNAAGTGARIALLNKTAREEIEALVKHIEKVETATEPRFQEHFIAAMAIPHAHEPFPNLAAKVELPGQATSKPTQASGRLPGLSRRRQRLARSGAQ